MNSSKNIKKVLVVDDSLTIRVYHTSLLKGFGFDVDVAENGMDGLEKAMSNQYDLILSDINMPVMDGYEFVRRIRKMENYKLTPVVFVTTLDSEKDKKKGFMAGATLYIVKPIDTEVMQKILDSI